MVYQWQLVVDVLDKIHTSQQTLKAEILWFLLAIKTVGNREISEMFAKQMQIILIKQNTVKFNCKI